MNCSKTNEMLNSINTSLSNQIYVGITETKAILNDIDINTSSINTALITIDNVLDNSYSMQTSQNSTLNAISASNSNILSQLSQTDSYVSSIDTTLSGSQSILINNGSTQTDIETELNTINDKLIDIGITLASQNTTEKYTTSLWWDGTSEGMSTKDDFTTNHKYAYWQNTTGATVYIVGFNIIYRTTDTSLEHWKVFNCDPADYLLGTSTNTSAVQNTIFNIDRQWTLSSAYDKNISLPTGDLMVWKLTNIRYPLLNNEYAIAELDADTDHANFVELYTQVVYETI